MPMLVALLMLMIVPMIILKRMRAIVVMIVVVVVVVVVDLSGVAVQVGHNAQDGRPGGSANRAAPGIPERTSNVM